MIVYNIQAVIQFAVAISSADAPPDAFVVWRGLSESIPRARRAGYDGVELALREAGQVDAAELHTMLDGEGLACPCISTGQVFATLGLYLTAADAGTRRRTTDVFRELIELAGRLGAMVNLGRARGYIEPGQTRADATGRFRDLVAPLCDCAASMGVQLIIEPINRYEINFVNTLEEGAELIAAVGRDGLGLMPDVFHMNIEERSIAGALEQAGPLISYVHLADSNRLAPGQGHIDFPAVFAALRTIGYDGWASVEILPQPDPDTAAVQAIEFLRPVRDAHA